MIAVASGGGVLYKVRPSAGSQWLVCLALSLLCLTACQSSRLDKALQGNQSPQPAASATPEQDQIAWVLIKNPYSSDEKSTEEPEYVWVKDEDIPATLNTLLFGKKSILAPPEVVTAYGPPPEGGRQSPLQSGPPRASRRAAIEQPVDRTPEQPVSPETSAKGYVVYIEKRRIVVDLTSADGLQQGSILILRRGGIALVHPMTGEKLGELDEEIGTARVVEIRERFSIAEILEVRSGYELQVKDRAGLKQE